MSKIVHSAESAPKKSKVSTENVVLFLKKDVKLVLVIMYFAATELGTAVMVKRKM